MSLRVLVNARAAKVAGGRTFLVEQLRALAGEPGVDLTILAGPAVADALAGDDTGWTLVRCRELPLPARMLWEQLVLPFRARAHDVVYMTGNFGMVLWSSRPQVVALQNALHFGPAARREAALLSGRTRIRLALERRLARRTLRHADASVAVSRTLAVAACGEEPGADVRAVPHAPPPPPSPSAPPAGLPPRYVLAVGHDYESKDWDGLIDAVAGDPALPALVLAGACRSESRARALIERGDGRLVLLGVIADPGQLAALYRDAACCVAHSRLESFGFTPHEALAQGTPVAVADLAAHREAYEGRPGVTFYPARDRHGLRAAVRAALTAPRPAPGCGDEDWSWRDNAAALCDVLREVSSAPRPRLLVVNQYYDGPEATGQVLRQVCEDLAGEFEIDIVAQAEAEDRPQPAGVRVRRVGRRRSARATLTSRALSYARFLAGVVRRLVWTRRPDVILSFTDPPLIGCLVGPYARLRRVPFAFAMQDMHPEVGMATGRLTNPVVVTVLRVARVVTLRCASRVVVIGRRMAERLEAGGADPAQLAVVPNWTDTELIEPAPRDNPWARRHGTVGRLTLMHSGNIGQLQGLEQLADAVGARDDMTLLIVGDGSRRMDLDRHVAERDYDNVRLLPFEPADRLRLSLASADVQVVSLLPGLAGLVEPSKVYGALASGRPVLAVVDPDSEAASVVAEAGAGIVVRAGDAAALDAALDRLAAATPGELAGWGAAGRALAVARCGRGRGTAAYGTLLRELAQAGAR